MGNIYISDLDGTLLNSEGNISDESKEILNTLIKKKNLNFSIATGRGVDTILPKIEGLNIKLPVIALDGAVIYDLEKKEHLFVNSIKKSDAERIIKIILDNKQETFVTGFDGSVNKFFYRQTKEPSMNFLVNEKKEAGYKYIEEIASYDTALETDIISFILLGDFEVLNGIKTILEAEIGSKVFITLQENFYLPGTFWMNILDSKSNKAEALKRLLPMIGFSKDRLTVFGDHINDIEMFNYAENKIAVDNAVDELKKYASQVIPDNNQNSVARYIKDLHY